ncbi:hypothetical protein DFH28DRAFT_882859 [Melampsora americana]|nr:hypothetical protein DFH28DRAFT_882859 [Melampsora americana]
MALSISTHIAISMSPSLKNVSKLNIEESKLDTALSAQACTRNVDRKKSSGIHWNTLKYQKEHKDDLTLEYQVHNKDIPKQAHRLHDATKIHGKFQSFTPNIETHIPVGSMNNQEEFSRVQVGQQRPSSKSHLISVLSPQESSSYVQRMSDGHHALKRTSVNPARDTDNPIIGHNKRRKGLGNQNQEEDNLDLGHQSLNKYFPKQPHRLYDGGKLHGRSSSSAQNMQQRYEFVGPEIKKPLPVGPMESQGKLSKGKSGISRPFSKGQLISELSGSKGSTSHMHNTIDEKCAIKQRTVNQARTYQTSKIDFKGINQRFQPDGLQIPAQHLRNIKSHNWQNQDKSVFKGKGKVSNISMIKNTSAQRISEVDLPSFYSHNPDKMCSAAAVHFTLDLLAVMQKKYQAHKRQTNWPTWEEAEHIWTTNTLLPFVYYVVSCNPTLRIWENIKHVTAHILKFYHRWYVTYHIAKVGTNTNLSQGDKITQMDRQLTVSGLSTLARNFLIIHNDEAFKNFSQHAKTRLYMLSRHVTKIFEGDYSRGYPYSQSNSQKNGSVWDSWTKRSLHIRNKSVDVPWPKVFDFQRCDSEPILFVNGDHEINLLVEKNNKMAVFIHQWEMDFKRTMEFIRTSQLPKSNLPALSVQDFCRAIHTFMSEQNPAKTHKYQVTTFCEFLHQDSQDKFYAKFWAHFEFLEDKKLTQALRQRKSVANMRKKAHL